MSPLTIRKVMMIALIGCMCHERPVFAQMPEQKHIAKDAASGRHNCLEPGDSMVYTSREVKVTGDVENPLILTTDSLKKMNVAAIAHYKVICQSGAEVKELTTCRGVLLKDILDNAGIIRHHHKDRNFYIVARATDGYKATFSWGELFNNPTGEQVYIIFEEDGMPIREHGDMILISGHDITTGPRHVYWLSSVEVNRVE